METSPLIRASQCSVTSPDGKHIATLNTARLEIRRTSTLNIVRAIDIPLRQSARFLCIRWSPIVKGAGASTRLLLSDEDTTRIWDLQDYEWSATIDNGSGGMGKIANVEFGSDDTEVLVFSSFGAKVSVWSLWTGTSVEIKDPKFATRGYGRSRTGRTGVFALLTRPAAQDMITLHMPGSYQTLRSFAIPTVDAQDLRWSPDGRWLAIWDTPRTGYRVLIFTADGNLFRTYSGDYFDDALVGLGVKSLEWSPNGDFLVIGGYEQALTMLTTRTFSPAVQLSHSNTIRGSGAVYQEQASSSGRSYVPVAQPVSPPTASPASGDSIPQLGISIMGFNADGSLLATKDDSLPTTVWIWDLANMVSRAVLIQHSVIKRLQWHPYNSDLLMIQTIQGESTLYLWSSKDNQAQVLDMPSLQFSGKAEARWLPTSLYKPPTLMFGDSHGFALAYPYSRQHYKRSPYFGAENDELQSISGDSDDSLFDVLSGKGQAAREEGMCDDAYNTATVNAVEDTFQFRKGVHVH